MIKTIGEGRLVLLLLPAGAISRVLCTEQACSEKKRI